MADVGDKNVGDRLDHFCRQHLRLGFWHPIINYIGIDICEIEFGIWISLSSMAFIWI